MYMNKRIQLATLLIYKSKQQVF